MKTIKKIFPLLPLFIALSALTTTSSFAYDEITREYQSVRTSGMGGVFETTGFYDQNFFGNPARVTANPTWRLTLLDPMVETDTSAISHVSALTSSGNTVQKVASTAGSDNHLRLQTTMPAYYLPPSQSRRWAIAAGFITSSELNFGLRNNYEVDDQAIIDIGPALTYGYEFLDDRSLSVGATGHFIYRVESKSPYTIADLLQGTSFSPSTSGAQGTGIDFDLGATKKLTEWQPFGCDVSVGMAIDNVMGGKFNGTVFHPLSTTNRPDPANRSFGGGFSVHRDSLFLMHDPTLALETSDIGNNTNGSFYRTIHLGGETRVIGVLLVRAGVNQGYATFGLGLDLKVVTIDAATYGEELGLNDGDMQDRRYALRVALQL